MTLVDDCGRVSSADGWHVPSVVRWCLAGALIVLAGVVGVATAVPGGSIAWVYVLGLSLSAVLPVVATAIPWRGQLVVRTAAALWLGLRMGNELPVLILTTRRQYGEFGYVPNVRFEEEVIGFLALLLLSVLVVPPGSWRSWRAPAEPPTVRTGRAVVALVTGMCGLVTIVVALVVPWRAVVADDGHWDIRAAYQVVSAVVPVPRLAYYLGSLAGVLFVVAGLFVCRAAAALACRVAGGILLVLAATGPVEALPRFRGPLDVVGPMLVLLGLAALLVAAVAAPYEGMRGRWPRPRLGAPTPPDGAEGAGPVAGGGGDMGSKGRTPAG